MSQFKKNPSHLRLMQGLFWMLGKECRLGWRIQMMKYISFVQVIFMNNNSNITNHTKGRHTSNQGHMQQDLEGNLGIQLSSYDQMEEYNRKTTLLDRKSKLLAKSSVETHRDFRSIFWICLILSISGMQFGLGLCEITTIWDNYGSKYGTIYKAYNFKISDPGVVLGMLVSFMPVGAFFGSLASKSILKRMSRKAAHHLNNLICMISSFALMQVNTPETILIGRFVYGWCIGCYCSWSPLMIKQIAPINLRQTMSSLFTIGRAFSVVLGYLFGIIFYSANVADYYRIIFCLPGALAVIQLFLMIFLVPDSPTQLFERKDYVKGRQVLEFIYKPEFVDTMFQKFKLEAEVTTLKTHKNVANVDTYPQLKPNFNRAIILGVHLNIFKQFLGYGTLVAYAGLVVSHTTNPPISPYTNFFANMITLLCTVIATIWIADRFGRRFLLLYSTLMFSVCNLLITVGLIINSPYLVLVCILILMGTFGIAYSIVEDAYPFQILKYDQATLVSHITWLALFLATFIPPLVSTSMPDNNIWPCFAFFTIYCIFSMFYKWFYVKESKNRLYADIIQDF